MWLWLYACDVVAGCTGRLIMPVNLDIIPAKAPDIRRPVTIRWVMFGVVIFLLGVGATLWFWQGERTGLKFWFAATCLPALIWGCLFTLRRAAYKLECVGTASWNKEREQVIVSETVRGQRFAWLVGEYLVNALETGEPGEVKTHQAAMNKSLILEHVMARNGGSSIRHSALPEQGKSQEILGGYAADICGHANDMLAILPRSMPCYLAFDGSDNIADLADTLFSNINFPLRRIRNLSGFSILDYWLDRHHDIPAALLIVSVQIYDDPPQDSGEAITIMLLSNHRFSGMPAPCVRIHRPQVSKQNTLDHALSRAMLWGKLENTAPLRGWITGGNLASDELWSNACAAFAPELTVQRTVNIDNVVGYAGTAAPWQSMILAARQCQADNEPQMVAVESAPSCHQLSAVTPE